MTGHQSPGGFSARDLEWMICSRLAKPVLTCRGLARNAGEAVSTPVMVMSVWGPYMAKPLEKRREIGDCHLALLGLFGNHRTSGSTESTLRRKPNAAIEIHWRTLELQLYPASCILGCSASGTMSGVLSTAAHTTPWEYEIDFRSA